MSIRNWIIAIALIGVATFLRCSYYPSYADAAEVSVRSSYGWSGSPHSAKKDHCLDDLTTQSFDIEGMFKRWSWFEADAGVGYTYLTMKESYREWSSDPRQDTHGVDSHMGRLYFKPTLRIPTEKVEIKWLADTIRVYGLLGVTYDSFDGGDVGYLLGYGIDVRLTESWSVGYQSYAVQRRDTGRYNLPVSLSLKYSF